MYSSVFGRTEWKSIAHAGLCWIEKGRSVQRRHVRAPARVCVSLCARVCPTSSERSSLALRHTSPTATVVSAVLYCAVSLPSLQLAADVFSLAVFLPLEPLTDRRPFFSPVCDSFLCDTLSPLRPELRRCPSLHLEVALSTFKAIFFPHASF